MKTITTALLCFFTLLSFGVQAQWGWNKNMIKGSGKIATKTITTGEYDKIKVNGSMDVEMVKGKEGKITVETDDNLLDLVEIRLENDVLVVDMKDNSSYSTRKGILVTIPVVEISSVSLNGSGDIWSKSRLHSNKLDVNLRGSGDINLDAETPILDIVLQGSGDIEMDVKAAVVKVELDGSGDIELEGTTEKLGIRLQGSGDVESKDLVASDVDVRIQGSGDVTVTSMGKLTADVGGSGDLVYNGNPEQTKMTTSGAGEIRKN